MINLILALVWLVLGVGLLVYHGITGDPRLRFLLGWVALALTLYNLVRWQGSRLFRSRHPSPLPRARSHARHRPDRPEQPAEPDPNFDFSQESPHARPPNGSPPGEGNG